MKTIRSIRFGLLGNGPKWSICRALSECGCSGIHHPAEPVRKVAERILLLVYKVNSRLVRKRLPPDDDITRRNLLYRQLFSEFDKLDIERKRDMLDVNKYSGHSSSELTSRTPTHSMRKSSCVESVERLQLNSSGGSRSSLYSTNSLSRPRRRSETRILKSKSGYSIKSISGISGNGVLSNGSGLNAHNGKQQYNEQLKRSMRDRKGSQSQSNTESLDDKTKTFRCPFCDWCYNGEQAQLDRHYWKSCPFLTKCPQCSQVLEVAALNYHLLNECEAKSSYAMCERCSEAVHKQLYDLHQMEDYCRELKTGAARCPLCHDDVHLPLDGGWKLHLMSSSGCPGNTRRRLKTPN